MEETKVIEALVKLGFSERKARKLIHSEREHRKAMQKKRDTKRIQKAVKNLMINLY